MDSRRWLAVVWEELEQATVVERPLHHRQDKEHIYGWIEDRTNQISINPAPATVDTLIHELFHRRYPHWPETYVKAKVSELMRVMTKEETDKLFAAYKLKARKVKKAKVVK